MSDLSAMRSESGRASRALLAFLIFAALVGTVLYQHFQIQELQRQLALATSEPVEHLQLQSKVRQLESNQKENEKLNSQVENLYKRLAEQMEETYRQRTEKSDLLMELRLMKISLRSGYSWPPPKIGCPVKLEELKTAVQKWAQERKLGPDAVVQVEQITAYLNLKGEHFPQCSQGGVYTFDKVRDNPRCSFPGHTLD